MASTDDAWGRAVAGEDCATAKGQEVALGGAQVLEQPASAVGDVPDFAEPLVGWRLWLVVADGGYLWLESILYATRWSPRRALAAVCVTHRRGVLCERANAKATAAHHAPAEDCECGIYAAMQSDTLAPYLESTYPGRAAVERVLGRVRLWGKVIECDRGWRAEHAYPERIYIPTRLTSRRAADKTQAIAAGLRDYGVAVSPLRSPTAPEVILGRQGNV
jgi:hypothetical protein